MISIIYGILDKLPALPSIPNMDSIIITIKDIINTTAYFIPLNHFFNNVWNMDCSNQF